MATVVQSCRIEADYAAVLSRQAKRRHLEVSTLSSLYLKEKALEEEFPGIGFRDSIGGREAYVLGYRVAVWEVVDVYREAKSIARLRRMGAVKAMGREAALRVAEIESACEGVGPNGCWSKWVANPPDRVKFPRSPNTLVAR